jgi:hypothetical protein
VNLLGFFTQNENVQSFQNDGLNFEGNQRKSKQIEANRRDSKTNLGLTFISGYFEIFAGFLGLFSFPGWAMLKSGIAF